MFQKLYRHLEEISASLREKDQGATPADEVREKMLLQLQELNESIRRREDEMATAQRKFIRFAALITGLSVFCVGVCIFGLIRMLPHRAGDAVQFHSPPSSLAAAATTDDAPDRAETARYRAHLQKLDTIVSEQAQTIKELKDLNKTAVITLRRIKKNFTDEKQKAVRVNQDADTLNSSASLPPR